MAEPLFPITRQPLSSADVVMTIQPYRHEGAWVFDDPAVGMQLEPFVAGISEMIDQLVAILPDALHGFRLSFVFRRRPIGSMCGRKPQARPRSSESLQAPVEMRLPREIKGVRTLSIHTLPAFGGHCLAWENATGTVRHLKTNR